MAGWWAICLCAEWCGVCRAYRPAFDALAARWPGLAVRWIDVEDRADLVGDVDVETFPTLLVAQGEQVRFFGPMAPHVPVLERLVESLMADPAGPARTDAVADALLRRIQHAEALDDLAPRPVGG